MKKKVIILGSTGSIGVSTLDVIRDFKDRFEVVGITTNRKTELLEKQIEEFGPKVACIADEEAAGQSKLAGRFPETRVLAGESSLVDMLLSYEADILVVATVGSVGLFPTLTGIECGMRIALANKEVLVVGGDLVMKRALKCGVEILPIDSEHNAIFQCLTGNDITRIRRLILTASGGPFRDMSAQAMQNVTREQALDHPTWNMGPKISIDSATLMNKGFEVIEACHLFGVRPDQVEVVVHPQSSIHSMVEYADGSILAQLGQTNMYLPILNVLAFPERVPNKFEPVDLVKLSSLEFLAPDKERFPCLSYAYEAAEKGGTMPAVLNAANEVAVSAFLENRIPFTGIPEIIRAAMDQHEPIAHPDLETLKEWDAKAREMAEKNTYDYA
ncbi:MAG: 1-deoxy-D-xylulose-5-phosphate reductoisomerase [Candidatus Sumerlaeia bacterium]